MIFLLILLFQIAPVNTQHPPISVPLTLPEKRVFQKVPITSFDKKDAAKQKLIDKYQPAGEPKASWKPCTEGYRGHMFRPEDVIYVWEVPKCSH